jgi:acyl carrier protein
MSPDRDSPENTRQRIMREVKEYLLAEFLPDRDPATLTDDTRLVSLGVLDSIAVLKLVAHLEEKYGTEIEAHEMSVDFLDTPARIAETIESKLS